jgi:hypothetical protein
MGTTVAFTMLCLAMTPSTSSDGSGVMSMLATETTMTMARQTLASRTMRRSCSTARSRCQQAVVLPSNGCSSAKYYSS